MAHLCGLQACFDHRPSAPAELDVYQLKRPADERPSKWRVKLMRINASTYFQRTLT